MVRSSFSAIQQSSLPCCFRPYFLVLVFMAFAVNLFCAAGGRHHMYKVGLAADACAPEDFHATYWTSDSNYQGAGSALIGTAYAQALIWDHQHPADCSKQKFMVWIPAPHGIGSTLHVMGQALALAMSLKRVLIVADDKGHPHSHPYFDPKYCAEHTSYHDCYFEAISSCTVSDAAAAKQVPGLPYDELTNVFALDQDRPHEVVVKLTFIPWDREGIPSVFEKFLEKSPVDPKKYYYWWRAQTVSYLVRPNNRTLREIDLRKQSTFPFRIGKGTISCHVRHGDKWKETSLVEDSVYVNTLETIYQVAQAEGQHLSRKVFLSTDDPESVKHFGNLTNWHAMFVDGERYPNRNKSTVEYAKEVGPANDMINSLLNLDLALQCDAWVGTLSSNWCRLIDEMRSTVRCKANGWYWDAQQGYPPTNLDWK